MPAPLDRSKRGNGNNAATSGSFAPIGPGIVPECCSPDVLAPVSAPKETAAQVDRSGGKESTYDRRDDKAKGHARATLNLVPAWNDDGHLTGWISLGEAAALALSHLGGRS